MCVPFLAVIIIMTVRHYIDLTAEAVHLPADQRIKLVERILDSLDAHGAHTETGWSQDVKDRISAFRLGGVEAMDFGDYLRKYEVK